MINLQAGSSIWFYFAIHNLDADSAAHPQIKRCSPNQDVSAWHQYQQSDRTFRSPNILSNMGRWDMTKSAALTLWWGWISQSLVVEKAAEPVEKLIPYQMRNMDPHHITTCASRCAFPPAGTFQRGIKMLSNRKRKFIIKYLCSLCCVLYNDTFVQ